uniref:Uncharacterized protein n=1 Tax=Globodera rostochiensis TaxID=31243 RepID=A0A914H679_GLORO
MANNLLLFLIAALTAVPAAPRDYYTMIVVFGPYDGPNQYEFHTDDKGALKFNFLKQIHQSNLIKEACKNIKSKINVTILVVKGGKNGKRRRILCEFKNYAEMLKKMEETNGQIYHAHTIEFEKLKKMKTVGWASQLEEVRLFSKDSEEDDLSDDEQSENQDFDDDRLEKLLAANTSLRVSDTDDKPVDKSRPANEHNYPINGKVNMDEVTVEDADSDSD